MGGLTIFDEQMEVGGERGGRTGIRLFKKKKINKPKKKMSC